MKLSKSQMKSWLIASNRVSLESIRYAADIVGYTDLVTATATTLENLIEGRAEANDCRVLYRKAKKSTFRTEPLLHAILIALKWGTSDGTGEFIVGNVVDAIYAVKFKTRQPNSDAETYRKLDEIHVSILGPYYQQLEKSAAK